MKRLIDTADRRPWPFILGLAIITLLALLQLPRLEINISAESMLEKDTPAWDFFQQSKAVFGGDNVTVVFIRDPQLFTPEKLELARELVPRLRELPFVTGAGSLFSVANIKNVDDEITSKLFFEDLSAAPEAIEADKADAVGSPLLQGTLISRDGDAIAINVFTRDPDQQGDFDSVATQAIEQVLDPLRDQFEEIYQIGGSVVRNELTEKILVDQQLVLPLSMLVLVVTLGVSLRRLSGAVIPVVTATLSVIWTLAFMVVMGIPINIMTSIVPAMIIVIGSTEDVHLLSEYLLGVRAGQSRKRAIRNMSNNMGLTVFLTFITTYVGFLSITLNNIELLFQFGLVASTGLLFNFLITVTVIPILLGRIGPGKTVQHNSHNLLDRLYQSLALAVLRFVRRHRVFSLVSIAAVCAVALLGASELRVNNNPMDYLQSGSEVRERAQQVHEELSGIHAFSVVVDAGIRDTFLQVEYLEEVEKIQNYIRETGTFDKVVSFVDFLYLVNQVMQGDEASYRLPGANEIVREYMLFLKHEDVQTYVSPEFDRARILVRHNIGSSERLNQEIEKLRQFIDEEVDPALRVEVTGESILSNEAVHAMSEGQFKSLLLIGGVVILVIALLFVNIRAGFVALLPNLFPVLVLFGVMGFFGIPMDAGTSMVAAIALGICVDDTMHAMSRFHNELKIHRNQEDALEGMVRAEAVPIFTTSVALAAGFAVLGTSSFIPVAHFGLLSAMVIGLALFSTFYITPLMLGGTQLITVWDLLSYKVQNDYLKRSPLFRGMNIWQIKKVLLASEIRKFAPGEIIIEEGSEGTEMFVVLEGVAEASRTASDGVFTSYRHFRTGDIFGEVAAFAGGKRTADVHARQDTEVLVLSWKRVNKLSKLFPIIAFRLFRNLAEILGQRLVQTQEYKVK